MDKLSYGLYLKRDDEILQLFFTDHQHWDDFCGDWTFCVLAVDAAGREYCISYTPPILDRYDDDEQDADYFERCAEECDWTNPYFVERVSPRSEPENWDIVDDPSCSVVWFD